MAEINEQIIRQIIKKYNNGYGVRLFCYSCPRIIWISLGDGRRDWTLRHDHIYVISIKPAGDLKVEISENGIPIQTTTISTWKELYAWLARWLNEKAVKAIEVERIMLETAWEDAETYDRLLDTATLRFLARD
jgi:hypothetical protein